MRVSFPLTAEGGRIRVALATLCAMALLAVAAASTPPAAHAEFTLNACQGGPTKGEGSSLQATAQEQVWTLSVFYTSFGCGSGAASTSPVSYKSDGRAKKNAPPFKQERQNRVNAPLKRALRRVMLH
jgi:hypothetical protein